MSENRYKKIVLEADNGITFKASEGTNGELIIRALKTNYNYANPPIPKGYNHICGAWNNGFVIERESDGSQFVWIPVGYLDPDGTLNGKDFIEKFGRRNYMYDKFSEGVYHETLTVELNKQIESVMKYGGFYISRYNISRSLDGKPQSIKGVKPLVKINFYNAKKAAAAVEDTELVQSHLMYGAEYDSVLAWFIKSGARTFEQVVTDSSTWGNHRNTTTDPQKRIIETGSREEWCVNNIYDFAGNVYEWTQEEYESSYYVTRGGSYYENGFDATVAIRSPMTPEFNIPDEAFIMLQNRIGFRAVLCIQ